MSTDMIESKRVRAFRLSIAKGIPKFPNNKKTLQTLEYKSLGSLLIHYANWACHYVSIRPREVRIEHTASNDPRWRTLSDQISSFLKKVKQGEDLNPHLSLQPHTKGYSPTASETGQEIDRWADKDFLLNVMGYHHFHLGPVNEEKGFAFRTDQVLFARVFRERFEVTGLFDHTVFDRSSSSDHEMSQERKRLWSIFRKQSTREVLPGTVVIPAFITTSGHQLHWSKLAEEYSRIVWEVDPLLNDHSYLLNLYKTAKAKPPKKPQLEWTLEFLDLGLWEKRLNTLFVLRKGPY